MSFALPDSMRSYITERVADGTYGNTSEYIRDLVRKDQTAQARIRLLTCIEEGLTSGRAEPITDAEESDLIALACGDIA